ncbi:MAG: hypothetical protein LBJ96_05810 [Holosporaceae bacterium]|jgi:hypothetical protein|nr:hypothetical protein [Holosporaceae bacterium]
MNGKILLLGMMLSGTSINAMQEFQPDRSVFYDPVMALVTEEEDEDEDEDIATIQRYFSTDPSFRDQMFSEALQYVSMNPSLLRDLSEEKIAARVEEIAVTMALTHVLPTPSVPELVDSNHEEKTYYVPFTINGVFAGGQYMQYRGGECIACRNG